MGDTTVKFAKGVEFGFDDEGELIDGKTALSLAGLMDNEIFPFSFVKSGNDLILDSDVQAKLAKRFSGGQPEMLNETLTVKDFFAENGAINGTIFGYDDEHKPETFDSEDRQVFQLGSENKANKMYDTKYQDALAGGNKADKFFISNGQAMITGGKGNDTINIEKTAIGTVNIEQTIGAGNDTLNIDSEVGESVEVMVDGIYSQMMVEGNADISFEKTGNDLIFNTTYFKDEEAGRKKDITDSLTVKGFFNNDFDVTFGYDGDEPDYLEDVLSDTHKKLIVNGVKDTDKASATYKKTVFEGTALNDSMTYAGKGASYMAGGEGADEYNVTLTKSSDLIIFDREGKNRVNLDCSYKDFRVLFNVNGDGEFIDGEDGLAPVMMFHKDSFTVKNLKKLENATGKVNFASYIDDELHYSFTTKDTAGTIGFDGYVNEIASEVGSWLADTDYTTSFEVFEKGSADDIKALVAIYDTAMTNDYIM